jgi:hypothetical protein
MSRLPCSQCKSYAAVLDSAEWKRRCRQLAVCSFASRSNRWGWDVAILTTCLRYDMMTYNPGLHRVDVLTADASISRPRRGGRWKKEEVAELLG